MDSWPVQVKLVEIEWGLLDMLTSCTDDAVLCSRPNENLWVEKHLSYIISNNFACDEIVVMSCTACG